MGFTVNHQGGATDTEFLNYARLLRQMGNDLGKLPRVRDPLTNKRWLYVWDVQEDARAFAEELKEQTGDLSWEVVPVNGPPSEGPLGPLVIQFVRQSDGLTFVLHILSRALIRSAFPQAVSAITFATLDPESWNVFKKAKGGLSELIREVAPLLTGLTPAQLAYLGYSVVDADTLETFVSVPPGEVAALEQAALPAAVS